MNLAKQIVTIGLVVSILAFIGFFNRERSLLQNEILDGVRLRSYLLKETMITARVIVSTMKETMEQNLILAKEIEYRHPALSEITYYPQYATYGLEPSQDQKATVHNATLTGSGRFDEVDISTQIEITSALTLDSTLRAAMNNFPELKWVYYTSANGFVFVAPSVAVEKFRFSYDLYKKEFWLSAAPQQNPTKASVISDVYVDAAGKGLMITCSEPIWINDTFYGVVSLDIGLDTMQRMLAAEVQIPGESLIVSDNGKMVAALRPFKPGEHFKLPDNFLQAEETQLMSDNRFLIALPVTDGNLWLIHHLPQSSVDVKAALRALPYWIIVVFTIVLAYLLIRLRESMKEVSRLATTDALTGTLNRRGFAFEATVLLAHCRRRDKSVCLLVLDIDNFKSVNDRYGHSVGDKALKFVADALRDLVRNEDLICRFGGDEFLVLFPETDLEQTKDVSERIREYIEETVIDPESKCQVTVSIGCTQVSVDEDLARAIARGDDALYVAKDKGRNRVIALDFA